MDLDDLMACGVTDRGLALDHEFTAHEHLRPVSIFVAVEQLPCHNAAEFFDLADLPVNRLLEDFIDHFEIPGKVRSLEAAGQVDVYIEIGDEDHRPFFAAVNFYEFLYVLYPDTGKVDTNVRRRSLDVGQFPAE
jgi:hypothetical protein